MENENNNQEAKKDKFDLKSRLIAISDIKKSRKMLEESVEKAKWLKKYLAPSIKSLFDQQDKITGDIMEALENREITVEDIEHISPY